MAKELQLIKPKRSGENCDFCGIFCVLKVRESIMMSRDSIKKKDKNEVKYIASEDGS